MKARELIKILEKNPDFDIETSFSGTDNSDWGYFVKTYILSKDYDVGYSDKVIKLVLEGK